MERHETHAVSYSSSDDHSYQNDNNKTIKNISSEGKLFIKEEEKNDWSNFIANNFEEIKDFIDTQGEINNGNEVKSYNKLINKNKENNNEKIKGKKSDKNKNKKKDNSKSKKKINDIIEKKEYKNKKEINKITLTNKKIENNEKKEKIVNENLEKNEKKEEKFEKFESKKEKEENEEKQKVLSNGIIVTKINLQKERDENTIIKENKKIMKENVIKKYFSQYDKIEKNKNPMIIKKPKKNFITKIFISKRKRRFIHKKLSKKTSNTNMRVSSLGNYNKLSNINRQSLPSTGNISLKRQNPKAKTLFVNRNQNNLDKLEDKLSSLSTLTAKKLSINNNSNLFFNSSNKNNVTKKRPLSSYNIIKKEIDINLKSSKVDSSFNNKSFNIQKTCQISSIINYNTNNNNKNIKKIIYENKNFLKDFKELKSAFELSESNINNNTHNDINNKNNYVSEGQNKKFMKKQYSENNLNKDALTIQNRKLNSATVRGNGYNYFYPKDPSPLFIEFGNNKNIYTNVKNSKFNICKKCGYKKHFGCEKDCPLCIQMKEKSKLEEKKLSNLSYYFPFKDKNNTNGCIQNSFRNNIKGINTQKIKEINNHDNFKNLMNIKMENIPLMEYYYNPFYLNSIQTTLNRKKRMRMNSAKDIRGDRNKIYNKYNALQKYFE